MISDIPERAQHRTVPAGKSQMPQAAGWGVGRRVWDSHVTSSLSHTPTYPSTVRNSWPSGSYNSIFIEHFVFPHISQ